MNMKKFATITALFVFATALTYGQGQAQQGATQPPNQRFNCKVLQIAADQKQLTVIQGAFQQSGIGGNNEKEQPNNPNAKKYTVSLNDRTDIHWQNFVGRDRQVQEGQKLTLDQLQQMANQRITIPMTVYYPANASLDESQPVIATEIVLLGSPPTNR